MRLESRIIFHLCILFSIVFLFSPISTKAAVLSPGNINTCGELAVSGIYTLTTSVSAAGTSTCFSVSADSVIIDGAGYTVSGSGPVAIDTRVRTGGVAGTLTEGANGYTNLVVNNLNISGFTTGINSSGNADASGLGTSNGYGGNGGDVAIYNSFVGSVTTQGGNSSTKQYGGLGGNMMFTNTNLNISSSTLSANGGVGTLGANTDGGLTLIYTGTLTRTNLVLSSLSFFNDNGTQYGVYIGGTWPILPGSVSNCGTLYGAGVHTLSRSLTGVTGTCFNIGSNDLTLDGAGYTISPAISTTTSYAINAGTYSNFTLASTTVTNFSNLINSSSSVNILGGNVNLSNQKITASSTYISAAILNASTTFITNALDINYSTSITGTTTASSTALSSLRINNLDYGARSAGLVFNDVWTTPTIVTNDYWRSIASSADGTKLVAVVQSGSIWTSTDSGRTWVKNTSAGTDWNAVTSDVSGNKLAAAGGSSRSIYTSVDGGLTWVVRNSSPKTCVAISSSADGTKLAAVASSDYVYTSTDSGATWSTRLSDTTRSWKSISSSADGNRLIASDGNYIFLSTDAGATWSTSTNAGSRSWNYVASSADGLKLTAVGTGSFGYVYISTDGGSTWATSSTALGTKNWKFVNSSADGTKIVAAELTYIYLSTDSGSTWKAQTSAGSGDWRSVSMSADGSKMAAVYYASSIYNYTNFNPTLSVDIIFPLAGTTVPAWSPKISWGISKYCYYSYDNFTSTSTANCSLAGSDVTPPSSAGNVTLYVRGVSNMGVTINRSVNFNNYSSQSILINLPTSITYDASTWKPSINYSVSNATLTACQYSYDNFVSTTTADCSKNGSDILPPAEGSNTLYIRTVDINSNVNTASISFTYLSHWNEKTAVGSKSWSSISSSYDGTKVVAVAMGGQIYTSTDSGSTWTPRDSSRSWQSVVSDSTGAKLAAVVNGGYIYTSTTSGATWVQKTSDTTRSWYSISSSADGTKLAAVEKLGYIYTSADSGTTWTRSTSTFSMGAKYWSSIASDASSTKLIASIGVAGSVSGYVYTSTDGGVTWATSTSLGQRYWTSVSSSADGTKLAAVAYGGPIYISTDSGANWVTRDSARNFYSISESADGTKLIAGVYADHPYTSTNGGVTWVPRTMSSNDGNVTIIGFVSGDGRKAFAGVGMGNSGYLYVIDLSVSESYINNFVSVTSPVLNAVYSSLSWLPSVNWGFNKTYCYYSYNNFVSTSTASCASGGADILAPLVDGANTLYVKSVDLLNNISSASVAFTYYASGWVSRTSQFPANRIWATITSDMTGNKLVAAEGSVANSRAGYIYTSTDGGVNWIQRTSSGLRYWQSIASSADGTKLAAVTQYNYIYTSTDSGATWVQKTSDATRIWYAIASSADGTKLVAAVQGGYIYTSTDSGNTWATSTSAGSRNWYSVASSADGVKLAAVVQGGYIYTSTDSGNTWAQKTVDTTRYWTSITSSADGTKLAAAIGYNGSGNIYTSSDSGASWTPRDSGRDWRSVVSSADGTRLIAAVWGNGNTYLSSDSGANWVAQTSAGTEYWISATLSADGTKQAVLSYSPGSVLTHKDIPRNLSVDILLPQAGVVSIWSPIISWGTATSCYYSYNNFTSTSTANCLLNGSDISLPSVAGSSTLYVKGIDASSTVRVASSTFMISSQYWCGTADSNWNNLSNWYTTNACSINSGSLPTTTSAAFLVGNVSPIISSSTTTLPYLINSTGLTGAANTAGVIFSGTTTNTTNIVGNITFNNSAYNMGTITGNAIFTTASSSTFILSGTMKWGGTISGTIKGVDALDITNLIFNNNSSNETTIPSNFTTTFNNSASNNGIINGSATFNNTGLFTMGTVNGTSTLNALSQTLNGINNVVNLVKRVVSAIRDTLFLTAGSTLNVSGSTTILGYDANNLLFVRSTTPGVFANFNINGTSSLNFLRLKDIKNAGTVLNLITSKVYDDGGNSGFILNASTTPSQRGMTSTYAGLSTPIYPGTINSCGVINQSGTYTLGGNLTNASGPCFTVYANNVIIDGSSNHYTVNTLSGNTSYAVMATSTTLDGGSAYGPTTIQNITFTGFAGGVNASGNNGMSGTMAGGNGGNVIVASSTVGTITASGGAGFSTGAKGNGGTISISNSTTSSVTSSGTNGTINISGTNPNLSNNTYTASSTFNLSYSGVLTTTNTTLSPLAHLIAQSTDYGSFVGGAFPILPGVVNSCGSLTLSGVYTLGGSITNISGSCFVVKTSGVTIDGSSNHYSLAAAGGNSSYAVVATSSNANGGAGYGTTTIQNITFTGFGGGINASGNSGIGTGGGAGGDIVIASSTIGAVLTSGGSSNSTNAGSAGNVSVTGSTVASVTSAGGNGASGGNGGNAGSITLTNSTSTGSVISTFGTNGGGAGTNGSGNTVTLANSSTGNVTSSGLGGIIAISGANLNLSNNTYTAGSTVNVNASGTLTTTNTTLSTLTHLIAQGTDYGAYAGGLFPLFPGTIASCGNLYFTGTYTLSGDTTSNCNILTSGITIIGGSHTLTGDITANNYGVTLSGINVTGNVSTTGAGAGALVVNGSSNLNGTISVTGAITGDHSSSLRNTTINAGGSVATSSVSFTADVINNGTIYSGNSITGKTTNNGTINGDFTFNASSTNAGTVNGNAIFNASSTNYFGTTTGSVTGTAKFNLLTASSGVVTFSGTTTFGGAGTVTGNILDSSGSPITGWVFNASSTNTGIIKGDAIFNNNSGNTISGIVQGNAIFNNTSTNLGNVTGNSTVNSPVVRPLGGTTNGQINYYGYPGLYFNDQSANDGGHGVAGKWNDVKNWWTDVGFTTHSPVIPTVGDSVNIYGNITNGGPATVRSAIFQGTSNNGIYLNVISTSSDAVLFNASSTNAVGGTVNGNATFTGGTDNFGTVTGHITRLYSAGIYTITGDLIHNGTLYLVQVIGLGTQVLLANATNYVGAIFQAINNGIFNWGLHTNVNPNLVINSTVIESNTKWSPNVSWGTNYLVQYKTDEVGGGVYVSASSTLNGSDIPRPSAGQHTYFFKSTDSQGDITEKSVTFTYNNISPASTDCLLPLDESTRQYYYLSNNIVGNCTLTASTTLRGNDGNGNYYTISGNLIGNNSSVTLQNLNVLGNISNFASINVSSSTLRGTIDVTGSLMSDTQSSFGTTTIESGATVYGGNFVGGVFNNGTIENGTTTPVIVSGNTTNNGSITGGFIFNALSINNGSVQGGAVLNGSSINAGTISGTTTLNGSSLNSGSVSGSLVFGTLSSLDGAVTFSSSTTFLGTGHVTGSIKDSLGNIITKWLFNDSSTNAGYTKGDTYFNGSSSNIGTIEGNAYVYAPVAMPLTGIVTGSTTYYAYSNGMAFRDSSGDGLWSNTSNWFTDTTLTTHTNRIPNSYEDVILFATTTLGADVTNNVYVATSGITIYGGYHKLTGNISGNGAYDGHDAYNFNLENITVTGTTTANGGDGIPGKSNGGRGGMINITTASTGGVTVNGGDPDHNGGDAGTSTIRNSLALVDGTRILAVGGASNGCGYGGNGGNISLIDSSGYILVTATGEDATSTCPVGQIPAAPANRSGGITTTVGKYTPPIMFSPPIIAPPRAVTSGGSFFAGVDISNLGKLNLSNLPTFGLDGIGQNFGVSKFVNPLAGILPPPMGNLTSLPKVDFSNRFGSFLTNSLPKSLITVFVNGKQREIKFAVNAGKVSQYVAVNPSELLDVNVKSPDKGIVNTSFNGGTIKTTSDKKNNIKFKIVAPKVSGTYVLQVGSVALQVKVDTTNTKSSSTKGKAPQVNTIQNTSNNPIPSSTTNTQNSQNNQAIQNIIKKTSLWDRVWKWVTGRE